MELTIGSKIRELRRECGLTQEEVAAHLGISFQAISKWERSDGYPDITMLPALARYFGVTVDALLGVNDAASQARYEEINRTWETNRAAGKHRENVALMQAALQDYPNDALLLVQLSASLERLERWQESAMVQEQILRYGGDSEICSATQFNICFTYQRLGEHEKALIQARKLPNLYKTRENALVCLARGEEKTRAALTPLQWAVKAHLVALAEATGKDELRQRAETICAMLAEI